jgi:hypothetical protein
MAQRAKSPSLNLSPPEQRMLQELCQIDSVGEAEAVRRAVRLAFFCRLVPDEVLLQTLQPNPPSEYDASVWHPTGEVRVSVRGELVAERLHPDGTTRWVPATPAEVQTYFDRPNKRRNGNVP